MTNSYHCPLCERKLSYPNLNGKHAIHFLFPGGEIRKFPLRQVLLSCNKCDIHVLFGDAEKRIASYLEYKDGMIYLRDNLH
jgi:hypothetical protein